MGGAVGEGVEGVAPYEGAAGSSGVSGVGTYGGVRGTWASEGVGRFREVKVDEEHVRGPVGEATREEHVEEQLLAGDRGNGVGMLGGSSRRMVQ